MYCLSLTWQHVLLKLFVLVSRSSGPQQPSPFNDDAFSSAFALAGRLRPCDSSHVMRWCLLQLQSPRRPPNMGRWRQVQRPFIYSPVGFFGLSRATRHAPWWYTCAQSPHPRHADHMTPSSFMFFSPAPKYITYGQMDDVCVPSVPLHLAPE